jgi:hypothetical protein
MNAVTVIEVVAVALALGVVVLGLSEAAGIGRRVQAGCRLFRFRQEAENARGYCSAST